MGPVTRPNGRISRILAVGASSLVTCVVLHGLAGAETLSNKNSIINFNLGTPAGMDSWTVDGADQLNQQWFWFRIGNSGPQLDLTQLTSSPFTSSLSAKQMTAIYSNAQYEVDLSYTLSGFSTGSGKSQLTESINFINKTGSSIDLHFFMYSDFTLGGPAFANNQNVFLSTTTNSSSAIQTVTGLNASNTVAINFPAANELEVASAPQLYNELTTSNAWVLNGVPTGGPGHETWGMEWDATLSPGGALGALSVTDTLQVPEPTLGVFALLGAAMLFRGKVKGKKR